MSVVLTYSQMDTLWSCIVALSIKGFLLAGCRLRRRLLWSCLESFSFKYNWRLSVCELACGYIFVTQFCFLCAHIFCIFVSNKTHQLKIRESHG